MKRFWTFLLQTIIAGILMLVPLVIVGILFERIWIRLEPLVGGVLARGGHENVLGELTVTILTLLALLVVCFAVGLLVRLPAFKSLRDWIERNLLRFVPGFEFVKTILAEKFGEERDSSTAMVLVEIDGWQPAILVEKTPDGRCVVYVPDAPNATGGSVHILPAESVRRLDAPLSAVVKSLRFYGRGLGQIAGPAPVRQPGPGPG